ncbi:MAG: (d)CMP kinase [Clostridia bacterium]|nr:(d)CMP kinase [Clostridia bacterium]
MKPLTIAIDGPVGAGKSTISDEVAKRLGILHLDTGAMYRAVGLAAVQNGIDPRDEDAVCRLCKDGRTQVDVKYENGHQITLLNGVDVSAAIRTQEAGSAASAVSRYQPVRKMLVARQQEMAQQQSMLLDGRDIGTVVLKDATVKIYLTASAQARATRRRNQLLEKGTDVPIDQILSEVNARDYQDTHRAVDPLRQAEDAVLLDSSSLSFEETVEAILNLVEEHA